MDLRMKVKNMTNNAQGDIFESLINTACIIYQQRGRAEVIKVPEPFRVTKKHANGEFTGRFIAKAHPDFSGTLPGGRAIHFEAKYTTTDRLKRGVLTDEQMRRLEMHTQLGAMTGVCAGIMDNYFFVPWTVWRDMKLHYGRQYVTVSDLERFRVKFIGAVMFLDYLNHWEVEA
jgi:penicillin-binding protein-related factor A (putative recombinase)